MTMLELLHEWQAREPEIIDRADENEIVFNLDDERVVVSTRDEQDVYRAITEILILKGERFTTKNAKVGGLRRAHIFASRQEFVGLGKTDTAALLKAYVRYIAVAKEA